MASKVKLETLTLNQVLDGSVYSQWDNPHSLAIPTPQKAQALRANPLAKDFELPAQIVAVVEGVIIGNMDMFEGEISISGERRSILWGSNLFVHPDYRHLAAGLGLLMQMQRSHPIVGVVGVSNMVYGVYQGLKWKQVVMPRVVAVAKSKSVLRSILKNGALASACSGFVDLGLQLQRALRLPTSDWRHLEVERVDKAPQDLYKILRSSAPFSPGRSVERLQWLLDNQFDANPTRKQALLVFREEGQSVGFVLLKQRYYSTTRRHFKDIEIASILDWGVLRGSRLSEQSVIARGLLEAIALGAHVIETPTASPDLQLALRRLGMRVVGQLDAFFKTAKGYEFEIDENSAGTLRGSDGDNYFA